MILIELGILFLVLIIYIAIQNGIIYLMPKCIINEYFHILCPSCGGTRCVVNFINGNFMDSFKYHPIFFIMIVYLIILNIVFIINSLKSGQKIKFIYPKNKFWIIFIVVLFIFTIFRNVFR